MQGSVTGKIPPQAGRLAVVTGGTSGLGFEIALNLAQGCVDVILAGRDEAKGHEALGRLRPLAPQALVRFEVLDLARQDSIAAFAQRLEKRNRPVDLLINNAGVMALPRREVTADGFEMQLATNYLGHFALTGLLLPLLRQGRRSRVVQVSSLAHRYGSIHFDDLHGQLDHAQMFLHRERGRFAGRADGDNAVNARGDLVFEQARKGLFIHEIIAERCDDGGISAHARGGGRRGHAWNEKNKPSEGRAA